MSMTTQNAHVRKQERYARILRLCKVLLRWRTRSKQPGVPHINDLSPRLLRDIGLDPNDRAARIHTLPSQTTYHPRG